jgi:hypothetical protein
VKPKLPALHNNPAVALTIDTEVHPPKILLIRGRAKVIDFETSLPSAVEELMRQQKQRQHA